MFTTNSTVLSKDITSIFASLSSTLGQAFNSRFNTLIKKLFANNEQGVFYDPFDMSTMYQDAAGTSAVTASAQPLGLMLDKSKGLKRSSNFNTNSTWTAGAEWTINGEIATVSGTGSYTNLDKGFTTSPVTKIGDILKISINVLSITGTLQVRLSGGDAAYITKAGVNTLFLKSGGNYGLVRFQGGNGVTATISLPSLVIEEVAGNHAYQTISAARPLFRQKPILGNDVVTKPINLNSSEWFLLGAGTTANGASFTVTGSVGAGPVFNNFEIGKEYLVDVAWSVNSNVAIEFRADALAAATLLYTSSARKAFFTFKAVTKNLYLRVLPFAGPDTITFTKLSITEITGYRTDQNYIEYDGVDDKLLTTFAAPLTNCTVVRAVPNEGTKILYNQTLPTSYEDTLNHSGFFAINRALNNSEKVLLLNEMDKRTGITSLDSQVTRSFVNNEVGVAFNDFNDMSVLFQDAAGTVPVTAVGQPVGLVLDKSRGLALSDELTTNGDFTNGSVGWTLTNSANVTSGALVLSNQYAAVEQVHNLLNGDLIELSYTVVEVSGTPTLFISASSYTGSSIALNSSLGTYKVRFRIADATKPFRLVQNSAGVTLKLDNVSIKKVLGNHAFQTVSASRPLLGRHPVTGVRNMIKYSEDSSRWNLYTGGTGSLPVVTYGFASPLGTNTATRIILDKGTGTTSADQSNVIPQASSTIGTVVGKSYTASVWMRTTDGTSKKVLIDFNGSSPDSGTVGLVTVTSTWARYVIKLTSAVDTARALCIRLRGTLGTDDYASIDVWAPQQEEGLDATAYQRTNGVYDVTEAGVASTNNLYFDGVDDFLQTNNIDFTSTDKVSVFAGVRKLSDANAAILCELGSDININNGSFYLAAPLNATTKGFALNAKGTIAGAAVTTSNNIAPASAVLTGFADLRSTQLKLRLSGIVTTAWVSLGVGNYGNYPLYIGRRGGTSIPFNGHLYSLIIMGRLASDTETAVLENAIAKQVGVTLNV